MLKRFAQFVRHHDWFAVAIEVLVLIVGLVLAFQIDRWREDRADRLQEQAYVKRLIIDIEADIVTLKYAIEIASLRLGFANLLVDVVRDPAAAEEKPSQFLVAVEQSSYTYTPSLTSHTFEVLRSTGNIGLILNQDIIDGLFDYYGFDEGQRQYRPLQLATEHRHFELSAGVLSLEQSMRIQDAWLIVAPDEIEEINQASADMDEVAGAVERLRARPDLVAWLPNIRGLQLEQKFVHELRLTRAQSVLDALNDYRIEMEGR